MPTDKGGTANAGHGLIRDSGSKPWTGKSQWGIARPDQTKAPKGKGPESSAR